MYLGGTPPLVDGPVPARPRARARGGFTLVEIQVAFVLLGLALAGVCPLVMMQLKLMRRLEARLPAYATYRLGRDGTWARDATSTQAVFYVVPLPEPMAGRFARGTLAAGDVLRAYANATSTPQATSPTQAVAVESITYQTANQSVTATVQVGP